MPPAFKPVESTPPSKTRTISPSVVESAAGCTAGIVSCLTVHPLDLLKNRLQLNTQTGSRVGDSLRIFRSVVQDEGGVRALYRGLWPNMLGNSLGWGLYFMFYGELKAVLRGRKARGENLTSAEFFSASGVAGMQTPI